MIDDNTHKQIQRNPIPLIQKIAFLTENVENVVQLDSLEISILRHVQGFEQLTEGVEHWCFHENRVGLTVLNSLIPFYHGIIIHLLAGLSFKID